MAMLTQTHQEPHRTHMTPNMLAFPLTGISTPEARHMAIEQTLIGLTNKLTKDGKHFINPYIQELMHAYIKAEQAGE